MKVGVLFRAIEGTRTEDNAQTDEITRSERKKAEIFRSETSPIFIEIFIDLVKYSALQNNFTMSICEDKNLSRKKMSTCNSPFNCSKNRPTLNNPSHC